MKKRILSCVAALVSLPLLAAVEIVDGVAWTYTVEAGEAILGGFNSSNGYSFGLAVPQSTTGSIIVPVALGGYPVTIGRGAFSYCSRLTSVTIPEGVPSIGDYAFEGCSGLMSVIIPSSVTNIDFMAFKGCSELKAFAVDAGNAYFQSVNGLLLTKYGDNERLVAGVNGSVTIPSNVAYIYPSAFAWCSGITEFSVDPSNDEYQSVNGLLLTKDGKTLVAGINGVVTIPSNVTNIGDWAFSGRSGLARVTLPEGVMNIGNRTFASCSGLTSVEIPSSAMNIGNSAFEGCSKLRTVTIHPGVTSIGEYAFCNCWELTSVVIPSSVTNIGECAFVSCIGLTDVMISEGVPDIGRSVFEGSRGLASVTIPSSVTNIDESAFYGCSGLSAFVVDAGNSVYQSVNGLLLTKDGKTLLAGVNGTVMIPSGVTNIGERAFAACSGLTSVAVPSSVTSVGRWAFYGCENLTVVYVEAGDADRVRGLLSDSGFDVLRVDFGFIGPSRGFSGESKQTFNGFVRGTDGMMCGMVQIATAKVTKKGEVKVSGFVMLEDGKKQALKAVSGKIENGLLTVATTCGKLGNLTLTIGGDGFVGSLGTMSVASETTDERLGVFKGALTLSYFDAKTGKVKTKKIAVGGVASGDEVVGTLTIKGQTGREFVVEIGE